MNGLDYFPGVHSRRWSGDASDDRGRNEKILELMKGEKDRNVYLISRFSLCNLNQEIFKTVVKNRFTMLDKIHGEHGFGYDSILMPSAISIIDACEDGRITLTQRDRLLDEHYSIADLTQKEKNAINNRGRIAKEISEFLGGYIG